MKNSRRIAVERVDPHARQRQFFARRRQQRGRDPHATSVPFQDRLNARRYLDSFRCHARRSEQTPSHNQARNRLARQLGGDLILLAPQTLETVAPDPTTLRPNGNSSLAEQSGAEEREEAEAERRDVLRNFERLSERNEIRLFDADREHTQRFRSRTLPDDFLNSEKTRDSNAEHIKKRAFHGVESNGVSITQRAGKRIRRDVPSSSVHDHHDLQPMPFSWRPRSSLSNQLHGNRSELSHDGHRNYPRTHRTEVYSLTPRQNKTRNSPLSQPPQPFLKYHEGEYCPGSRPASRRRNTTGVLPLHAHAPFCRSTSPNKPVSEVSPRVRSTDHRISTRSVEPHRLAHIAIPRSVGEKDWLCHSQLSHMEEGVSKGEAPAVDKKILASISTLKKFPPIEINSESEAASDGEQSARAQHNSFQCILSREPFELNHISAEVWRIEHEMLNDPDQEVNIFSHPRRRREDLINKGSASYFHSGSDAYFVNTNKSQDPFVVGKEDMAPKLNRPMSKRGTTASSDPVRHSILENELNVTLPLSPKNPVTEAAATEGVDSIKISEDNETP